MEPWNGILIWKTLTEITVSGRFSVNSVHYNLTLSSNLSHLPQLCPWFVCLAEVSITLVPDYSFGIGFYSWISPVLQDRPQGRSKGHTAPPLDNYCIPIGLDRGIYWVNQNQLQAPYRQPVSAM